MWWCEVGLFNRKKNIEKRSITIGDIVNSDYMSNLNAFAFNYAHNLHRIPEVQTAIEMFANIFSTIPKYVERTSRDGTVQYFTNLTDRILNLKPNAFQNATQFWKEAVTKLMFHNNVFILPTFDIEARLESLVVLPYKSFDIYAKGNVARVKFFDSTTGTVDYNMNDIIYLNRFSTLTKGRKNNLGLYETVANALMHQALKVADPKRVKAIMKGRVGGSSSLKPVDKKGTMEDLKLNFSSNVDGIAFMENQYEITPVNWQENDVNRDLMQTVINTVYNYFGMNEKIINGTCTELEYSLFLNNSMKWLADQVESEFTSKLFTQNEIYFGNKIEMDILALNVSTLAAKSSFIQNSLRSGVLNIDEAREMVGYPPLPNGFGQMWRTTADTIDVTKVNEYQAAQKGVDTSGITSGVDDIKS